MNDPFRHWSPALRRAVMKVRPDYFTWPLAQQERYGTNLPDEDRAALDAALLHHLLPQHYGTPEQAAQALDDLPPEHQNAWNAARLPLMGVGEDSFFLNEHFAEGQSLLDFPTLYDYDAYDHAFQEEHRQKDHPGYQPRPYRGSLHYSWARFFIEGRFTYATLTMASRYIHARASDAASDRLDALVPHQYVPGPEHGHRDGQGNIRWDMRPSAVGEEGMLDELRHRLRAWEAGQLALLEEAWDSKQLRGVYWLDEDGDEPTDERNLHLVFTDKDVLAAMRFRTFVRDCRAAERPVAELQHAIDAHCAAAIHFIETQHAEVLRTWDPKVTPLRKRHKIMVAPGAHRDFLGGDDA